MIASGGFAIGRGALVVSQLSQQELLTINIVNATFKGNTAANGNGGALKAFMAIVTATDVAFIGNEARGAGGAVYLELVQAAFSHCQFLNNTAAGLGGAIYHSSSALGLSNCSFLGNAADSSGTDSGAVRGPVSGDRWSSNSGGAIYALRCKDRMLLSASELGHNRANERGGAVALLTCGMTAEGSSFYNNTAKLGGGAVAAGLKTVDDNATGVPLLLKSSNLTGNTAVMEAGGSVFIESLPLTVEHSRLEYNTANQQGGAVYMGPSSLLIVSGTIMRANQAGVTGGAVHAQGAPTGQPVAVLQGLQAWENRARTAGGALWLSGWKLQLSALEVSDNGVSTATVAGTGNVGGAMYVANCIGDASISNASYFGNVAFQGGALYVELCGMQIKNSTFGNNNATGGDAAYHITLFVNETHFLDNSAELEGGAVHLQSLFDSCNFGRNNASNSGGAMYHETSAVHLSNCKFYDNSAGIGSTTASNAGVAQGISTAGGGIFAASCTGIMEIRNCELLRNQADGMGGGMSLLTCETMMESSTLTGNVGKLSGGGVAAGHQATTSKPQHCNLTGNKGVKQDGGAVHTAGVPFLLHDSRFLNNSAHRQGGALFSFAAPLVLLTESTFAGNIVDLSGGAALFASPKVLQVKSTAMVENTAGLSGGGLALVNAYCSHFEGLSFAANAAAQGGGIHVVMTEFTRSPAGDGLDCLGDFTALLGGNWTEHLSNASRTVIETKKDDLVLVATNISAIGNLARLDQGGVVLFEAIRGSVLLDSFTARANRAGNAGGAIAVSNSLIDGTTVYLSSSDLQSNAAVERGGALALDGASTHQQVVAINTTLNSNTAGLGGAVSLQQLASVALHGCILEGNVADGGGATGEGSGGSVHAYACKLLLASETRIEASVASEGYGGGIYTEGCDLVMLSKVRLTGNNASAIGGAAFLSGSSNVNAAASLAFVSGGRMDGNTAGGVDGGGGTSRNKAAFLRTGSAGALYLGGSMTFLVDQTLFDGNIADAQGGAVGIDLDCPQAMQQAARRSNSFSCWTAILKEPRLWGNTAGGSGGAVFSSSPYTLAMICGSNWTVSPTPGASTDQQLAGLVTTTTSRVASSSSSLDVVNVDTGQVELLQDSDNWDISTTAPYMGLLPKADTGTDSCFWRPQISVTAAGDSEEGTLPNRARLGYGDAVATAPKVVVLVAIGEGEPAMTYVRNRLGVLGDALKNASASSENGTSLMAVGSGSSGAGSDTSRPSSQGPWWPLWMSRAVLELRSRRASQCWPGQECRLIMPTNVAMGLNISIFDAIKQVVNDTGDLKPVVRATIASSDPSRRADLLGNPLAQVDSGSASLEAVRVHARKGNYTLTLAVDVNIDFQVTPLIINVTVPPCSFGELPLDNGYVCSKCPVDTFTLRVDNDDSYNGRSKPADENCAACPYHAKCTGGAVLVPEQGYWHSAANSTIIHQCPNMDACRNDDDDANNELLRCQERWYAYFGEASRFSSLLRDPTGGTSLVGIYLDLYRKVAAVPNNTYNGSLYTPLSPEGIFDGFLLDCALWGVRSDDLLSYMQKQCSETIFSKIVHEADLTCSPCFSKVASAFIGLAFFVGNTAWLGFSVLMTFMTDYTLPNEEGLPAADLLKVLIVHYQFFLIVTRININWPNSIVGLQAVVGSITGSVKQVLAGLLMPIFSVIMVMFLWTLRHCA
ncbi:hypothetical protein VOLCADRAFT_117619 [Volvox carteri f. nagariensis]|uniref:Right handed beta helix domain-containing protein n=1 Tax=Volvox carteri f. nagariensis TaxID=3068 RepID=D8TW26_VOLCA|nr:uncharacterized protein VOLCADRAFT_117619 [Volvox carteri f. nagariensis]EFJ48294.1 hypothetical protein VOLCADRAFT_117619 [Volvox carteri f. nagariensis]|eukprot:XP_002950548.1 hypothetical protein VOLCADRAFT_117619 [Volvox carteri f. nagariensis]